MKDFQKSKKKIKETKEIKLKKEIIKPSFFSSLKKIKKINLAFPIIFILILDISLIFISLQFLKTIEDNKVFAVQGELKNSNIFPYIDFNPTINTSAYSMIVYEKDSRVVVYGKNENLRFTPASTTKIMTALVSLDYYPLDKYIKAENIGSVTGSKIYLRDGEEVKVEDLLYGLLLPSGNDVAFTLAQNYNGGFEFFVGKMNEKARNLKLTNTYFVDPSGLSDQNYTSAFDLARLAAYGLENPEFKKIVGTKNKVIYDRFGKNVHNLANLNKLLDEEGVYGVKTGFTEEAGGVLVTAIFFNKKTYIIVVLKSQDRFYDTEEIIKGVVKNIKLMQY